MSNENSIGLDHPIGRGQHLPDDSTTDAEGHAASAGRIDDGSNDDAEGHGKHSPPDQDDVEGHGKHSPPDQDDVEGHGKHSPPDQDDVEGHAATNGRINWRPLEGGAER